MTEQRQCRQFGSAPDRAIALEREAALEVSHSGTAIATLGGWMYRARSRIDAQVKLGKAGPALACLPSAPPQPDKDDASIDPDIRDSAHGIRRVYIRTACGRFAALIAEPSTSSRRPTVLLVHGYMGDKHDFQLIIPYLVAAGHRVCAIDLRGHSETALLQGTETDDDVRLSALGRDVLAIIAVLSCEPVHLVGCSMGGLVAQEAALIAAGSIATLTLCGSGPGAVGIRHARELRRLSVALRVLPRDCVWKAMRAYQARRSPTCGGPAVNAERERLLHHRFRLHSRRALRVLASELQIAKDRSGEVAELGLRTLVMHGARENVWPPDRQRAMAKRLNAPLVAIPDAGHSAHVDNPGRTARALLAFYADADAAGQPAPSATGAVTTTPLHRRRAEMAASVGSHERSSAA